MYGFSDTYTIVAQEHLTLDALPDMSVVHWDLTEKTTPYPVLHVYKLYISIPLFTSLGHVDNFNTLY